tara:strand:- start:69 stop:188 length:120 start_codon:yes stop_codon:yes gene_type:complete
MKDKENKGIIKVNVPTYITRKRKMKVRVARGWMALAKNN